MTKKSSRIIDGQEVILSNLDKIFWPEEKITKGDLINYYLSVADFVLPHLEKRPESLLRYPNGIKGKKFYQKNYLEAPAWVGQEEVEMEQEPINFLFIENKAMLAYVINLGCIDLNPWLSITGTLDRPDFAVLDLDPLKIPFDAVVKTALAVKKVCDRLQIKSYPKTSGATGMHIFIPLGAKYTYEQARNFAEILANLVNNELPDITSVKRQPTQRQGKVYIDFLQNARGQTLASVYSVRPRLGAPVSAPLDWSEVKVGLDPKVFNIFNIKKRIEKIGDIFAPVLTEANDIQKVLEKIGKK